MATNQPSLESLVDGHKVVAVLCCGWGDSGKGKVVNSLGEWADLNIRGIGGPNAGHTCYIDNEELIVHMIPTGIIFDKPGRITAIGQGTVINAQTLCDELDELDRRGQSYAGLRISQNASLILPHHIHYDLERNRSQSNGGIGSTGRGVGPAYADHRARAAIRVIDALDQDRLVRRLDAVKKYHPDLDIDATISYLAPHTWRLAPYVSEVESLVRQYVHDGKKILLEGAQGLLLSVDHGTYPYVTSSDCSLNGLASGAGISAKAVDKVLGIVKFPFTTRVGGGPFPTELGGDRSRTRCAVDITVKKELDEFGIPHTLLDSRIASLGVHYKRDDPKILQLIDSQDEYERGIGIRLIAGEYGATTKRPRRVGWTDATTVRYAVALNGPSLILTKADTLAGIDNFKIAFGYKVNDKLHLEFNRDPDFLECAKPIYKQFNGYDSLNDVSDWSDLPPALAMSIRDLEEFTGGHVEALSVGPKRNQNILRE